MLCQSLYCRCTGLGVTRVCVSNRSYRDWDGSKARSELTRQANASSASLPPPRLAHEGKPLILDLRSLNVQVSRSCRAISRACTVRERLIPEACSQVANKKVLLSPRRLHLGRSKLLTNRLRTSVSISSCVRRIRRVCLSAP